LFESADVAVPSEDFDVDGVDINVDDNDAGVVVVSGLINLNK